ncbi:liprin-beta-1 [Leptopilina heterotoma]|uniref:liprin-beta-1 n=1 Tax=Leptopilina heterotoma TaxID=63436 RepID=UPI001CA9668D|nr:liprin-beta-1 [Leptopilina heterotoma]
MGKSQLNQSQSKTKESTLLNKSSDASRMLEAALLQMDGIISGTCAENSEANNEWKDSVVDSAKNLVTAITEAQCPLPSLDKEVVEVLLKWLQPEYLKKLENERSVLCMEISVLSEQVDAQSNKIHELEQILQENVSSFKQMEEALQKEVLARSNLETQKLELLTSLSEIKLKVATLEHENIALRTSNQFSNGEQFSRFTGQYNSLPRSSTTSKGVMFALEQTQLNKKEVSEEPKLSKPFATFSTEDIGKWLIKLGLECYVDELKKWKATGQKLLSSMQHQIERELDIKNPLHCKKLLFAIEFERCHGEGFHGSDKMDNAAVLRWLDDIGLPQHKEAFQIGKVDGRVLDRLVTEDLFNLGVISQLHASSLRRGIQVLRDLDFQFDNLERRSLNGNFVDGTNIALWTNHRVMEWLRVVDLAEYAPNLRGSGVHGSLMVYEGRFTAELLATLLSISPAKSLLRRHLVTHFNELLGKDIVQHKREVESSPGFIPLTITARLKVPKKSQFTLKRKKSKNEIDFSNLVCPLESTESCTSTNPSASNQHSVTL